MYQYYATQKWSTLIGCSKSRLFLTNQSVLFQFSKTTLCKNLVMTLGPSHSLTQSQSSTKFILKNPRLLFVFLRHQDSKSQPSDYESPPLTTRPGLTPNKFFVNVCSHLKTIFKWKSVEWSWEIFQSWTLKNVCQILIKIHRQCSRMIPSLIHSCWVLLPQPLIHWTPTRVVFQSHNWYMF